MKTKKTQQPKIEDFTAYCAVDTVNEKCKKILNSNLNDNLKVELIGLLQNPAPRIQGTLEPVFTYATWPFNSGKVEVTCKGE